MNSILTSVKKLLGIAEECTDFDADIIMYIQTMAPVCTGADGRGARRKGTPFPGKKTKWTGVHC